MIRASLLSRTWSQGCREAAAIESPHDERGAIVKAYAVLNESYRDNDELTEKLQNHIKRKLLYTSIHGELSMLASFQKLQAERSGVLSSKKKRDKSSETIFLGRSPETEISREESVRIDGIFSEPPSARERFTRNHMNT